ncbi:putative mannosyl-oligosaccharide alpha-1,2-mannosidase [Pseudocercospora fuligena]|uniref:alpha-1,2-Mannosidase n=1 Tax=Pseudocercospora fuligena TaxID=685502 RepID=A0A8H6VJ07_9PEZI|nr:putative mannosyl-oligosaccharide alpha-1,2-mannosidase [Pseudocercospora fuligena]
MLARLPFVFISLVAVVAAVDLQNDIQYSQLASSDPTPVAAKPEKPVTLTRTVVPNPAKTGAPTTNGTSVCKDVQAKGIQGDSRKAEAIKEAFMHGYNAYRKYAFGYDEIMPLSANGTNNRYGWGLTIVDSIDTAIIMGLTDVVQEMLQYISQIDFTTPGTGDEPIQLFETNIRYIGGLISAYDLLKSGQFSTPGQYDEQQVDLLLDQAKKLTDKVAYGFNTPTGIPAVFVNFTTNEPLYDTYQDPATNVTYNSTNSASIGTFILEFARLSDLTGNNTYRELAERGNSYLVNPSPPPVFPSLVGTQFDVDTGNMLTFNGGWQAGVDSFLEYLVKYYQYAVTETSTAYKEFWLDATKSTIDNLALHPFGHPELTFISRQSRNGSIEWLADDFSCFAGGGWLLGGALLDRSEISQLGVAWTDGCHHTYNTSTTGLGPLAFAWFNEKGGAFDPTDVNDTAFQKSQAARGYFLPAGVENWFSRPEPIESLFYAHRITGDPRWAEYAWTVFKAMNTTSRTNIAWAAVNNVDMPYGGSMSDALDSFFFAEVLKYLYLTFTGPEVINLSEWVFNTEAHPFSTSCSGEGTSKAPTKIPQGHTGVGSQHHRRQHP